MAFLDDLKDVANKAIDAGSEAVELTKLKTSVASVTRNMNQSFAKLGKIYFDSLDDTEITSDEVKGIVEEINKYKLEIENLNKKIDDLNNNKM